MGITDDYLYGGYGEVPEKPYISDPNHEGPDHFWYDRPNPNYRPGGLDRPSGLLYPTPNGSSGTSLLKSEVYKEGIAECQNSEVSGVSHTKVEGYYPWYSRCDYNYTLEGILGGLFGCVIFAPLIGVGAAIGFGITEKYLGKADFVETGALIGAVIVASALFYTGYKAVKDE